MNRNKLNKKLNSIKKRAMNAATWCWATLPRKIISSLVIVGILFSSIWLLLLKPKPVEAGWWDEDWLYRRAVTVDNKTTAETDVYISFSGDVDRLFIDTSDSDKFQVDCGDLRFTKIDGTQLDYYIVSGCGGASTIVHVKLDTLQAGAQTIYFYYGNSSAVNGFIGTDFSTEASSYSIDLIDDEEIGIGPVLWLKFDEGYGAFAYNSTENNAGKLPGTQLDTTHPLANGLAGLWLMNEGTGNTVADLSENGNDGTSVNSPIWVPGESGSAIRFDGTNYVDYGDKDIFTFSDGSTDIPFSIVIKVWMDDKDTHQTFMRKAVASLDNREWSFSIYSDDIQLTLEDETPSHSWIGRKIVNVTDAEYSAQWLHLAATYDGSGTSAGIRIYKDGVRIDTTDHEGTLEVGDGYVAMSNKTASMQIGPSMVGMVSYALLYRDRALSASEIAQLYAEPFAMISDTGASRISGASWTDFGKFDKALDFNGDGDVVTVIRDASVNFQNKSAYSISTWIYPHSDGKNDVGKIIDKGANTYIQVVNEGADGYLDLQAGLDLDSGDDPTLTIENAVRINRWSHILLVWEDGGDDEFTIYVNGINMGTSSGGSGVPEDDSDEDLLIGGDAIGGDATASFDGIIDEVIIYPYARSPVQVKRSYNQGAAARIGRDDSWITDGLVGYWKMDESSGNADDSSGAGTTLINEGTATFAGGRFANGTSLNGSDQYFQVADNTTLSITGDIVLSAWVYADTVSGTDVIVGKWDGGNETYLLSLEGGKPRMYIDSSSNYQTTDSATVSTSTWTLVTGTYDASAGKVRLYINGREENSSTTGTIPTSIADDGGRFHIGAEDSTGGAANFFDGKIDDVRVYNRELSGFEVMRLYDWGPPPVGHWTFDEGSGSSANDSTENTNTGTFTGDPTWKGSAECKFGNCLEFDGIEDYVDVGNNSSLDITDEITISMWLKEDVLGSSKGFISKDRYGDIFGIIYFHGYALRWYNVNIDGTSHSATHSTYLTVDDIGKWTHVVLTWKSDGTLKWYKNGADVGAISKVSGDWVGAANTSALPVLIGKNQEKEYYFNGKIDDVRIYNYALTPKQVTEVMMGGRPAITETTSSPGVTMGYWKFDEGFGTTAYDASGRSNNLTHSAEAYTMSGKFGKAWDGDGTEYLEIADDSDFDFTETEDFSISGWFKHSPISTSNDYIIAKHESGTAGGYKIYMDDDGDIAFAIDDDGTWGPEDVIGDDQARNYDDNAWHYFAAVKRGTSSMRLYVDGREIDNDTSLAATGSLVNGAKLYVGVDSDETDAFDGELDEIKIYRFALSPEEILLDYNKGKAVIMGGVGTELQGAADQKPAFGTSGSQLNTDHPLAQGIVGLWLMNEGTGTTIADLSGNGNTGTFVNSPIWTLGSYGSVVDFGGTDERIDIPYATILDLEPPFSIVVRFRRDDTAGGDILVGQNGGELSVSLVQSEAHTLRIKTGGGTRKITGSTAITDTLWHDAVMVVEKYGEVGAGSIYLDGLAETLVENRAQTITHGGADWNIGSGPESIAPFNGKIAFIYFYNRALTASEIAQLYAEPFAMLNLPTVPSFSQNRAYCPPGYVGLCNPPVGEYKFDEYSGSDAYDTSGNTNNGTISGASWKGSADCKYNSCLNFDGTDDVVTITQDNSINMSGKSGYTMSAWIYPHSDGENDVGEIIYKGTNTFLRLNTESDGLDVEASLDLVTADATLNIDDIIFPNAWYHIVMTYEDDDDDEITIYINGANQGSSTDGNGSLAASDTNNLLIGGDTGANFDGIIDDVKIFDYALSQEQVAWVYNKGRPVGQWKFDEGEGPITYNSNTNDGGKLPGLRLDTDHSLSNGLVGLWLMNENTGTSVFDLSGNGKIGTLEADAHFVSGKFGPAVTFDGDGDDILTDDTTVLNGASELTIIVWVRKGTASFADERYIMSKDGGGADNFFLSILGSDRIYFHLFTSEGDVAHNNGDYVIADTNWHQIVVRYDGANVYAYVDTFLSAEQNALTGTVNVTAHAFLIGARSGGTKYFWGDIDNIMIWNRALSSSEITQLYAEPFAMISDTGASSITGAAWNSSGRYNSALDFDGVDDVVTVAIDSDIDLNNKTGYSVCGWINPDADGENDAEEWFSKGDSYIRVDTESGGTVEVSALFDLATDASLNTSQTIPTGFWSHICTTWKDDDDDELTIYINGLNAGSSTNGSGAPEDDSTSHLYIGGDSSNNFDGDIDEVTIYNYELTAEQVKIDYNQGAALRFGD